jgi:poly(3-hydroxybutyrate) depolymerase
VISSPLQLDKNSVQQGETITGTVTFQNCNSLPLAVQRFIIGGRPPGGTHTGGPFDDFTPDHGAVTLPVGGTLTITASRAIGGSDPPGNWYSFATYQDMSDAWHDGPDVAFTVVQGASVPANPIAFTKDMPFTTQSGTTNYVYVPQAYDSTHKTPITLFVWLHGCGGASSGDIWVVSPGGAQQSWISLAPGGAEGGCWNMSTDPDKVLAAIADLKTHFNIDPKRVILGGYSSGGDLTYRTAFYNASLFAGVVACNSSPFRDTGATESALLAAASWKFNVVHLAHLEDTTYPIATVRSETDAVKAAGHPMTRIEVDGGHWDDPGAMENGHAVPGTDADIRTYLFPYLSAGWTAP